ncbi:MAG: class I SAM-dependent methyltransferase [bacterium]
MAKSDPLGEVRRVYSFWGRNSSLYDMLCSVAFLGKNGYLRRKAVEKLKLRGGDRVLEVACGTGLDLPYLVGAVGEEGKVIALDYTAEMLNATRRRAEKNGWGNVGFVRGDAARLAFRKEQFDGVICAFGMSVIPRYREALREAIDALKMGRIIVICDARMPQGFWSAFNPAIELLFEKFTTWDYRRNVDEELKKLLNEVDVEEFIGGSIYIASGVKR